MTTPRTPAGDPPRADAARNRERILDAAAVTLARNAGASLTDIADAAGLSRATAYRHFADVDAIREALLQEAAEIGRDLLREPLAALLSPDGPQEPIIDVMARLLRASLPIEHRWTQAISSEPIPDGGLIDAFAPVGAAVLRRAQAAGELRADFDPERVAPALIALVLHAVRRVHSEQLAPADAMAMIRPYLDGLRKRGSR